MILKIGEHGSISKVIKDKIFLFQFALMKDAIQIPLYFSLIFSFISFIPIVSVMFLTHPLAPDYLNKCFTTFLFHDINKNFNISPSMILSFVFGYQLSLILSIIIKLKNPFGSKELTKFLYLQIQFYLFMIVPSTAYIIQNIKNIWKNQQHPSIILEIYIAINQILIIGVLGIFKKLQFYFFRINNFKWRLSNQKQFFQFILNIFRAFLFTLSQNYRTTVLMVSLMGQMYIKFIANQNINRRIQQIDQNKVNLIIVTHFVLLFQCFTSNKNLASELLLFLIFATIIKGLVLHINYKKKEQFIPLCNCESTQFYNFYYDIKQNSQNSSKNRAVCERDQQQIESKQNLLKIHLNNCKNKKCGLKYLNLDFTKQTIIPQLQLICHSFIEKFSKNSKRNNLIFQIWKFQLGLKNNFVLIKNKNHCFQQQFIIFGLQIATKFTGANDIAFTNNVLLLKTTFLDKLQYTTQLYSKFYQQIAKPEPKLDSILSIGNQINQIVKILQIVSASMLKNNGMTFKMAELYMQFKNYSNLNLDQNNFGTIKKIQKNTQILDLQDLYLPAITFYPQNGNIQNVNLECISFLGLSKVEIKSHKINQIIYPHISDFVSLNIKNINKTQTFLMKGNYNDYQFGKITIRQKFIQNKKINYLVIEKQTYSPLKNVFLIMKENLSMMAQLKKQPLKIYNNRQQKVIEINWTYLFDNYLLSNLNLLITQKVLKISISELNCQIMLNFSSTISSQYFLVKAKYIKSINSKGGRNSSMAFQKKKQINAIGYLQKKNFEFFYDINDEQTNQIVLRGTDNQQYKDNRQKLNKKSLGYIQNQLRSFLVAKTVLTNGHQCKGIKTYRLWKKDLYNIDLQDKQRYNEQFEQHIFQNSQKLVTENTQIDYYLLLVSTLICWVMIFLCAYMLVCSNNSSIVIKTSTLQLFELQKTNIYISQIVGFTRDAQNGYYSMYGLDWKKDVLWSYQKIKQIRNNSKIFSSIQRTLTLNNIDYSGNFNQLFDGVLQQIYYIATDVHPLNNIEPIHLIIVQIFENIFNEQIQIKMKVISSQISFLKDTEIKITIILGASILLCFLILGWILRLRQLQIYEKLKKIMMMSDSHAISNMQNADHLKYAIEMIKKNFEFDFKSNFQLNTKTKSRRKKPKQINMGKQKKIIIFFIFLSLIASSIWFLINFSQNFTTQMDKTSFNLDQTLNIMKTFVQTIEISNYIDHTGITNKAQITDLMQTIKTISLSKQYFEFNQQLLVYTNIVLFQDSCQYLKQKQVFEDQNINCKNSTPGFTIQNPLQIGMVYYLGNIHYNLINNVTDTYAATGIFSKQFVNIYIQWVNLIQKYEKQLYKEAFSNIENSCWILIIASTTLMVVIILINIWTKQFVKKVSQIISFFAISIKRKDDKTKFYKQIAEILNLLKVQTNAPVLMIMILKNGKSLMKNEQRKEQ